MLEVKMNKHSFFRHWIFTVRFIVLHLNSPAHVLPFSVHFFVYFFEGFVCFDTAKLLFWNGL
jgi:hypothetical protein